jgi:hypothetical protein
LLGALFLAMDKLQFIGQFLRRRRNRFPLGGSWHKIGASEPIL